MRRIFLLIIAVLFASGCQTFLQSGSPKISPTADIAIPKSTESHLMDVEVDENLKNMLSSISFRNVAESTGRYILISGSIKKPIGVSIDRKKIRVSLLNSEGSVLAVGLDKVSVVRLRRPVGSRGRFSIKLPYDPEIKKCKIGFEDK